MSRLRAERDFPWKQPYRPSAGEGPGIHVLPFFAASKDVDGRNKSGHDEHLGQSKWKLL
jgi:hypothetical protein